MACCKRLAMEIISTYIQEHNLFFLGIAQNAKIQNGLHKYLIHITFYLFLRISCVTYGF